MRREMLRLLSRRALTEKELSRIMGLSPPSIGHHLNALREGELISRVRSEAGGHGIIQKWYVANAQAFIVDRERLPNDVRRYFMPIDIERARGVTACMSVLGKSVASSTRSMETLTHQVCRAICRTAEKYRGPLEDDPEKVIHQIYSEALRNTESVNSTLRPFLRPMEVPAT
jgi:DNA-binding transcriptional ArsR family regulator